MASTITPLPDPPSRSEPATFTPRADGLMGALPQFVTQANALAESVESDAITAAESAAIATAAVSEATAAAISAASATNAVMFVSGTYADGDGVWSPVTYHTYRCKQAGTYSTDPSQDSAHWVRLSYNPIVSHVSATDSTTLPVNATSLTITPAIYGVVVWLPDATLCDIGGPLHVVHNAGSYPVVLRDASNGLVGFISANTASIITLADNSTVSGAWIASNTTELGVSVCKPYTSLYALGKVIDMGGGKHVLLGTMTTGYLGAAVYDGSANVMGTEVTYRTGSSLYYVALKIASDKILVVSNQINNTAMKAVVLTVSGTSITVGSETSITLSGNFGGFTDLIEFNGSYIVGYNISGSTTAQIRALTISGATVTAGAAAITSGQTPFLFNMSGTLVVLSAYSVLYSTPYTVSGTTLTAGTGATTGTNGMCQIAVVLGNRIAATWAEGGGAISGVIVSLSGTTTTHSVVQLFTTGSVSDATVVAGKLLVLNDQTTSNCNLLTDSAGTAVAGTRLTACGNATKATLFVDGDYCVVADLSFSIVKINCSTTSPTIASTIMPTGTYTANSSSYTSAVTSFPTRTLGATNYKLERRGVNAIYGQKYARTIWNPATSPFASVVDGDVFSRIAPASLLYIAPNCPGSTDSERWTSGGGYLYKMECLP